MKKLRLKELSNFPSPRLYLGNRTELVGQAVSTNTQTNKKKLPLITMPLGLRYFKYPNYPQLLCGLKDCLPLISQSSSPSNLLLYLLGQTALLLISSILATIPLTHLHWRTNIRIIDFHMYIISLGSCTGLVKCVCIIPILPTRKEELRRHWSSHWDTASRIWELGTESVIQVFCFKSSVCF